VLLAKRVQEERRAAAATVVWVMMIVGFAVTAGLAGRWLDPYTPARLVMVSGGVQLMACVVAMLACRAGAARAGATCRPRRASPLPRGTGAGLAGADARRFTIFVFVSMLAYSAQDLILEPFAGIRFGFTPGESTQLSGVQHGGTLLGMLLASLAGRPCAGHFLRLAARLDHRRLPGLGLGHQRPGGRGVVGPRWPLRANVFALGVANGAFSIAAIGSMMALAGQGRAAREGVRMGLWGAAQAIGFAVGGVLGTAASDLARWLLGSQVAAYAACLRARRCCCGRGRYWPPHRGARIACRRARPQPGALEEACMDKSTPTTWSWSAAGLPVPPPPTTWHARAAACCCSTATGASSPAAAPSRRG
jgi:BCD family chlorophyll transporter-like MFS transporter